MNVSKVVMLRQEQLELLMGLVTEETLRIMGKEYDGKLGDLMELREVFETINEVMLSE